MFTHRLLQTQPANFQENPSLHTQPDTCETSTGSSIAEGLTAFFLGRVFQNFWGKKKKRWHALFHSWHTKTSKVSLCSSVLMSLWCWFYFLHTHTGECFRRDPSPCSLWAMMGPPPMPSPKEGPRFVWLSTVFRPEEGHLLLLPVCPIPAKEDRKSASCPHPGLRGKQPSGARSLGSGTRAGNAAALPKVPDKGSPTKGGVGMVL